MAELKIISENKLRYLAGLKGFNLIYLEKDYFLTILLYLIKDIDGICFKGGTALNKIFLNHARLSEDLDFTCQKKIPNIKDKILDILKIDKDIFLKYNFENETRNFFRLKIFYKSLFSKISYIILDVNKRATVMLRPQKQKIPHFYDDIPNFEILTINKNELIAEKIRALITRNQPRDYFDVYIILKMGYKIDFGLVKKKLKDVNQEFDVERIFKNAKKIYSRWEEDMQLTNKPVAYITMIKSLQKAFNYKIK